jgi:hypothetical protein
MMRMNTETFSEAPTHRGTRLIAAIAFLPMFTAVLYLNGWAYHEGYLDYFHLPSSMFPLDLQATLVHGVMAWLDGGTKALIWMGQSVADHWIWVLISIIVVASVRPLSRYFSAFLRTKRLPDFVVKWHLPHWTKKLILELMRGVSVVYLVLYIPFAILSAMLVVLLILVGPFQSVGQDIAIRDARKSFAESPVVYLTAPDGVRQSFRLISCEGPFCALYVSQHAVVVPRESITWASAMKMGPILSPAK